MRDTREKTGVRNYYDGWSEQGAIGDIAERLARLEAKAAPPKRSVQIIDNYKFAEKADGFPQLIKKVISQDRISNSSWYDLSDAAYQEYLQWQAKAEPPKESQMHGMEEDERYKYCECSLCQEYRKSKEPLYTPDQLAILNALYTLGWRFAKSGILYCDNDLRGGQSIHRVIFSGVEWLHNLSYKDKPFDIAKAVGK